MIWKISRRRKPTYLSHFKLREKPFKISTDLRFLWLGEKHKEALETLRYGVLHNDGFIVVTGDVGTGKTTLASALINDLGDQVIAGTFSYFDVSGVDFVRLIARSFGIENIFQSKVSFLSHFESCLRNSFSAGKKAILIIDEAQRLTSDNLKELLHLSNIEENGSRMLNLVFVGQNEFNDILLEEPNKALRQRVAINYKLIPLTRDETRKYISHRLRVAECKRDIFTPEAIEEIFRFSCGVPRLINIVCDRALLATYFACGKKVRPEAVRECVQQLRLPNERKESGGGGSDHLSGMAEKVGNTIGEKIRGEISPEMVRRNVRKRPGVAAYVAAMGLLLVLFGFIFLLHKDGYLQQDSMYEEANKEVSRNSNPPPTKMETLMEEESSRIPPLAVEKIAASDGTGNGSDPSARQEKSGVPEEIKKFKETSVPSVKKEKQETVASRTSAGSGRQTFTGSLPGERGSSKKEESFDDGRKAALDSNKGKIQSPGLMNGQQTQETSSKQTEEVEPDKVIEWLLERRSDKK